MSLRSAVRNLGLAVAAVLSALAIPVQAQSSAHLIVHPVAGVLSVRQADGQSHLVYELLLVNLGRTSMRIDEVMVRDETDQLVQTIAGPALGAAMSTNTAELKPSQSVILFLDIAAPGDEALPAHLEHHFTTTTLAAENQEMVDVGGIAVSQAAAPEQTEIVVSAPLEVSDGGAVVLQPPVRGGNWVAYRACCDLATSHRGTLAVVDGSIRMPERFAIDFIQMDSSDRMLTGPGNELNSYVHYGEPVYAVADSVVVSSRNDQPEQAPGALGLVDDHVAGGNSVVLDLGNGRYAHYSHLQPGSVTVHPGNHVRSGQVLGNIGNSGRSIGPHLHFHVSDGPRMSDANGEPFLMSNFVSRGIIDQEGFAVAFQGQPAPILKDLTGNHAETMPANGQIMSFSY